MKIDVVENADIKLWNNLVENSDHATIFHTSDWLSVGQERWNLMVAVSGKNIPLAGFVQEVPEYRKKNGNSITPYGGPLIARHNMTGAQASKLNFSLVSAFEQALSKRECLPFMTSPWMNDLRPFVISRWNVSLLYTNIIDSLQSEPLEKTISGNCSSKIRIALNGGAHAEVYNSAHPAIVERLLELTKKSYNRQNIPVRFNQHEAGEAFAKLANSGNAYFVAVSEKSGDISCALGIFAFNGRAHMLISGHDREIATNGVVNLALYKAIEHARDMGMEEFDFEGSFLAGIDRFFREFGGKPRAFYEVSLPNKMFSMP